MARRTKTAAEPVVAGAPAAPPVQAAGAAVDPAVQAAYAAGDAAAEAAYAAADAARESAGPTAGAAAGTTARRAKPPSGRALLLGDAAGAFLLADEARYRTLERAFGIRREDANFATALGLLLLANAAYERAHRPKVPQPSTAVADLTILGGVLRESIYGVAGPASRDTPLTGTLIALAIFGGLARQPLARGLRGAKTASTRLTHTFRGRYGHLVGAARRD